MSSAVRRPFAAERRKKSVLDKDVPTAGLMQNFGTSKQSRTRALQSSLPVYTNNSMALSKKKANTKSPEMTSWLKFTL